MRAGQISDSYSYDPFGEITAVTHDGTAKTPLEAKNDNGLSDNDVLWGYNGEEYIEEVGLQYLRQRHYSPETGNFTSQDTNEGDLTNPLSQNRYIYAENDPVNGNDPGGDKKKSKKSSTKKTSKKSSKSSSKSSKKTSKKTNKKTTSKKSPSKKKATSKKSSSKKKSGSKWNKFKSYVKGRYTATKKGVKKGYRVLKDKATALKKSVTCKAKQAKSFAKKQIRNAKAQISKAKHTLKTKATNAITYVKNNPGKLAKSALKGMGKALSSIPGVKQISMALGATKAVQGLKEKLYAWADKIKTGFTPSTSMKMQMEQNYTAYLQNNSSYKSSKEYQDAFKNKTLRDDLEIIEAQVNIAFIFSGGSETRTAKALYKNSIVDIAKSSQGNENYPGIDAWKFEKLKKGSVYYRGEPNGTDFFTTKKAILSSNKSKEKLFKGLQVRKHEVLGYRKEMHGYMLTKDIGAAKSKALANTDFGDGGLQQKLIPNANDLIKNGDLVLVDIIELK